MSGRAEGRVASASIGMTDYPLMGVVRVTGHVTVFNFAPMISLELVKLGTSNLVC